MKLTVDCTLTHQSLALLQDGALAYLLSKANVIQLDLPLEAVVCDQHGLMAVPDDPIAPVAASADGLEVGDAYWLRAAPVHLMLQRDSFSLGEPVPLHVTREHAESIMANLNQHFSRDGLTFLVGNSGACYLRLNQAPRIKTTLPSMAIGRNVYQFMPQGVAASVWVAYLNEIQMLLHEHPVNIVRESNGQVAVNSIWLSGGGVMPTFSTSVRPGKIDFILADSAFYRGLASWAKLPNQTLSESLESDLQNIASQQHVRLELLPQKLLDKSFRTLLNALKARSIEQLTLNLGCYEKTLVATIKPIDFYKFWRKNKPFSALLT